MLVAIQGIDLLQRRRQHFIPYKPAQPILPRKHNLLHHRRALPLDLAPLNVLSHIIVQGGRLAPLALVRRRCDAVSEGDGIDDRAVRAAAEGVAHVENGVAEEGDSGGGPGPDGFAFADDVHVGGVKADHLGELAKARVNAWLGGALEHLGLQLGAGEFVGEAAPVVEVAVWRAGAEHDVGVFGIDGVLGVAFGKGGEGVLPGGEHDILIVWAEGMCGVSFRTIQMCVAVAGGGGVRFTIDLPGDPNNFEVLSVSGTLK